ncbi:MAG: Type IV pilus pilin [Parcubacteria bacterium C7867-001]|nr:MAG: Type IV pilus pilin [Parcubacteria bacterium C7867-001]
MKTLHGFSLPETLVVVALVATAGLALNGALASFYQKNAYIFESASAVDIAQRGLSESVTALREASYGADGSYPVESIATSSVTFYADVDGNGAVERVKLRLQSGTLYRVRTVAAGSPPSYSGQTPSTTTLATNVSNATSTPIFRYYDVDGSEITSTTSPQNVRSVSVRLDIDLNPRRAPTISTMSGAATLRNLRDQ